MAGRSDARAFGDGDLDDRHRNSGRDVYASCSTLTAYALVTNNPKRIPLMRGIAILGAVVVLALPIATQATPAAH